MAQDRDWSRLDFNQDLMTPGEFNIGGESMDTLSFELDDPPPPPIDLNVPINALRVQRQAMGYEPADASSGYQTTPDSSQVPTYYTAHTVYTVSSLGESSRQYQHDTHRDEPKVDYSWSQTDFAFFGSDPILANAPCPQHLNIPVEPTVEGLNAEETLSPPSASVRPEPDSRRTTTSHNLGVPSQGAQSTSNNDPLRDALMRMLGPNPTRHRVSRVLQDLGGICTDLNALLDARTSVKGVQMPPPQRPPSVRKPKRRQRREPPKTYRCLRCEVTAVKSHVFKRHVETKHCPQYDYHCHLKHCTALIEKPLHRPDKLPDHYDHAHGLDPPSKSIIEANRDEHICPLICALCHRLVDDWDDFYACFLEHCEVKPGASKASPHRDSHCRGKKRRRDNSDEDNFDSGADNGGFVPQEESRHSSHAGGTSNPRPSGSGDNQQGRSHHQDGCNHHSSRPQLDVHHLQDQPTSHGSRRHCKSCQHDFETCSHCCNSPPSTPWCHACPDPQRSLAIQADLLHAGPTRGFLPHTGQTIGVADHIWTDPQAFPDESSSIPTIAAGNHSLYGAIPQEPQQLSMRLLQRAHAGGLYPGTDTQQSPFASDQSLTIGAVPDVQVAGLSELNMKPSISDPKSKMAQSLDNWSGILTFRGSLPPARRPYTRVNLAPQLFIGSVSLNKANLSSMCQCSCRIRSQGTYFARSRVDIAPGRRIEIGFKMPPEARGSGHPLRTCIQAVVRVLGLRSSVARSANGKHKQAALAVLKEIEAPPDSSETKAINSGEEFKVVHTDNNDYDSDATSIADSTFSASSRVSSWNDFTLFSPEPSSSLALKSTGIPSCTELKLLVPARPSSPLCWDSDDDTNSGEQLIKFVEPYEGEEDELELTLGLDLESSLNNMPRWTRVPTSNFSSDISVQDPDRVFEYFVRYMLFVIVSLARARDYNPHPCLAERRHRQP